MNKTRNLHNFSISCTSSNNMTVEECGQLQSAELTQLFLTQNDVQVAYTT